MKLLAKPELNKTRLLKGIPQYKLAKKAKIAPCTYSEIEKKRTFTKPETAKRIADFFELQIEDLFEIVERKKKMVKRNENDKS